MSYKPYDAIIQKTLDLVSLSQDTSSVRMIMLNNSGSLLQGLKVVSSNVLNGNLQLASVSAENTILASLGLTEESIVNGEEGAIIRSGLIKDISTGLGYGVVYLNKDGNLTNTQPNIGINGFVAGDFILRVGVIVKNKDNVLKKDIVVDFNIVGQL